MSKSRGNFLGILCLLCLAQPAWLAAGQNTGPSPAQSSQLPFRLVHGRFITVTGRIGTLTGLKLVLDTGTSLTVVDRHLADRLRLPCRKDTPLINLSSAIVVERCTVPEMEIGPLRRSNISIYAANLTSVSDSLEGADALVGMDLLGATRFTVDYSAGLVELQPVDAPAAQAPSRQAQICMTTVIQIQGHLLRVIVDTGAESIILYENRLRREVPDLQTAGKIEAVKLGPRLHAKRVTLPGVQVGKTAARYPVLLIPEPPGNLPGDIAGFLGVSVLKARRVRFDFSANSLTWER